MGGKTATGRCDGEDMWQELSSFDPKNSTRGGDTLTRKTMTTFHSLTHLRPHAAPRSDIPCFVFFTFHMTAEGGTACRECMSR